ncbi:hypothetical protein MRY87_06970 [bacterium]|nr:hypothetical protein [bacterium]
MVLADRFLPIASREGREAIQELSQRSEDQRRGMKESSSGEGLGGTVAIREDARLSAPVLVRAREGHRTLPDQTEVLFSFEDPFAELEAHEITRIRLLPRKGGLHYSGMAELLTATSNIRMIRFDTQREDWALVSSQRPIDFQQGARGESMLLEKERDTLSLSLLPDTSQTTHSVALPPPCIHGEIVPTPDRSYGQWLGAVRCQDGLAFRWFLFRRKGDDTLSLTELPSLHNEIRALLFANGSITTIETGDDDFLLYERKLVTPAPDAGEPLSPLYRFPLRITPVQLSRHQDGTLVRVRQGMWHSFLLFPYSSTAVHRKSASPSPLLFSQEGCSLSLPPALSEFASPFHTMTFRCEHPLHLVPPSSVEVRATSSSNSSVIHQGRSVNLLASTSSIFSRTDSHKRVLMTAYTAYGKHVPDGFHPLLATLYDAGWTIVVPHLSEAEGDSPEQRKAAQASLLRSLGGEVRKQWSPSHLLGLAKSAGAWPFVASLALHAKESPHCQPLFDQLILEMPVVSPHTQLSLEERYLSQEQKEWGMITDHRFQEFYRSVDPVHQEIPLVIPQLYLRVAEHDLLVPAEPVLQWASELVLAQKSWGNGLFTHSPQVVIEISENADHRGAYESSDELLSLARQKMFVESYEAGRDFRRSSTSCEAS